MKKIISSVIIAAVLSVSMVFPAFAVSVKENPAYSWEMKDGKWNVTSSDGTSVKGWAAHGTGIYYLSAKGVMRTGWIKDDGQWYYLYTADDAAKGTSIAVGTLATNTWIDNYYVDENGIWTKTR